MVRRAFATSLVALGAMMMGSAALVVPVSASPIQERVSLAAGASAPPWTMAYQRGDSTQDGPESRRSSRVHDLVTALSARGDGPGLPPYGSAAGQLARSAVPPRWSEGTRPLGPSRGEPYAYDDPGVARSAEGVGSLAEGASSQALGGANGRAGMATVVSDATTTHSLLTYTPSRTGAADDWWRASNVGPNRPGTLVPESFDLSVAGQKFSVHPNATKHMAEYATSTGGGSVPISSLAGSVEQALAQGLRPGRNFVTIGWWELGIDTNGNVIYHAVYRP